MALAVLACTTGAANAGGDPVKGANVYKRCAICHTDNKGGGDGLGPNLFGIAGRRQPAGRAFPIPRRCRNPASSGPRAT